MKRIDLTNYEAFLLDYSEGNLDADDFALLMDFVNAHPELEIDLNDLNLPSINEELHVADFKSSLKKDKTEIPDEEVINYIEGKLSKDQRIAFETKLAQDKQLAIDLKAYQKTFLITDHTVVYDNKPALVKTEDDLLLSNKLILFVENQLSNSERSQIETQLLVNTDLRIELDLLLKTRLIADPLLAYPTKETLKKKNRLIVLFSLRSIGSMAAAILVVVGFLAIIKFYTTNQTDVDAISIVKNPKIEKSVTSSSPLAAIKTKQNQLDTLDLARIKKKKVKIQPANINKEEPLIAKDLKQENLIAEIKSESGDTQKTNEKRKEDLRQEDKQNTELAPNTVLTKSDSSLKKRNYLEVSEDVFEEVAFIDSKENEKTSFWKRAVKLASKANKLGVKAIDGQEDSENKFKLSFNSFSVEKK